MAPVSGISTGLIQEADKYVLLTDINGGEDHYGDMDFKVAGTEKGVTAIQLDVKIPGISLEICEETFKRTRVARMAILSTMLKAIPEPRKELSPYAPQDSCRHHSRRQNRRAHWPGRQGHQKTHG